MLAKILLLSLGINNTQDAYKRYYFSIFYFGIVSYTDTAYQVFTATNYRKIKFTKTLQIHLGHHSTKFLAFLF